MGRTTSDRDAERAFALDREPADRALYDEYVRGFDEIPVLSDVVRVPPRRALDPSFVRGERRSLRREERPDGYSQREASLAELESCYREYSAPAPLSAKRKKARKTASSKRPRTRKRAAAASA